MKPALAPQSPVVDLVETNSHYLLALDLPTAPVQHPEIELQGHELRVVGQNQEEPGVFFRCKTLGKRARAVYYHGALWLSLPKVNVA